MDIFNIKNTKNYRMGLDNNINSFYFGGIYTGNNIRYSIGKNNCGKD